MAIPEAKIVGALILEIFLRTVSSDDAVRFSLVRFLRAQSLRL
jgi:hypothetical protein